jgi:hypothetical protein
MPSARGCCGMFSRISVPIPPPRWTVVGASDSQKACEQVADDKRKTPWNQPKDGSMMLVRFVCLPDTVDPRGPKGK